MNDSEHFFVRGLTFFGTGGLGSGPSQTSGTNQCYDLRLENCRFLYSPVKTMVKTTKRSGRGSGERIRVWSNVLEFCEGSMDYKASAGEVAYNYLAFNAFEQAGMYSIQNQAIRSVVHHNTLLYNGDKGGHVNWGHGNHLYRNLIIGQAFLRPGFDTAVFHTTASSQQTTVIEENWCLGPSNVLCIRLDTATSTPPIAGGRYTQMRKNVHFGLGNTLKGFNHTYEHNTGDNLNVVWEWKLIDNHNEQSYVRYNAYQTVKSRGSKLPKDAIPGYSAINACDDMDICNPSLDTMRIVHPDLAQQIRTMQPLINICDELIDCWLTAGGEAQGDKLEGGGQDGFAIGDGLGNYHPYEIPTPRLKDKAHDFRPRRGSKLILRDPDGTSNDGMIYSPTHTVYSYQGNTVTKNLPDPRIVPEVFDGYMGAYSPDEDLWVPGSGDVTPFPFEHIQSDWGVWKGSCPDYTSRSRPTEACRCDPGYTGPDGGPCFACPAGTYKVSVGSGECTPCPKSTNSTQGSDEAADCTCGVGFSGPDGGPCVACVEGKYKGSTGSAQCNACPDHTTTSNSGSDDISDCACSTGFAEISQVQSVLYMEEGPQWEVLENSALTKTIPVIKGVTYDVKIEVLLSGLNQGRNKITDILVGGDNLGTCNPPNYNAPAFSQIEECSFFDCLSGCESLACGDDKHPHTVPRAKTVTASADEIQISMLYTRHWSSCSCPLDTWECEKERSKPEHVGVAAVARVTLMPVSIDQNSPLAESQLHPSSMPTNFCARCKEGAFKGLVGSGLCEPCPEDSNSAAGSATCVFGGGFIGSRYENPGPQLLNVASQSFRYINLPACPLQSGHLCNFFSSLISSGMLDLNRQPGSASPFTDARVYF